MDGRVEGSPGLVNGLRRPRIEQVADDPGFGDGDGNGAQLKDSPPRWNKWCEPHGFASVYSIISAKAVTVLE